MQPGAVAKLLLLSPQGRHLSAQPSPWEHQTPAVSATALDLLLPTETLIVSPACAAILVFTA